MQVIEIPARKETEKQRVAVYCRVSTPRDVQEESLETQKASFISRINRTPNWVPAGVYADKLSGLNAEKRPQFMQMINDALDGKIDRILCKSVSRFSRNVVEFKKYIDMLKAKDIAVEFEKEHLKTDEPSTTFILSLMATVANNESKSLSQNVKLGYSYRYRRGQYKLGNNRIKGYDTVDDKLVPNADAGTVKKIFSEYAEGVSFEEISRGLAEMGIKSKNGTPICNRTLKYMLKNETYKGDKELWKTIPRDLYTKKPDPKAKKDSIYLTDDHEAIVDDLTWYKVQARLHSRKALSNNVGKLSGQPHFLFGRIFCAKCGEPFVRRTCTHAKKENYKAWTCRKRLRGKGGEKCTNDIVKEDELIRSITFELGWESFDEERFLREVSRVVIDGKKVSVIRKM